MYRLLLINMLIILIQINQPILCQNEYKIKYWTENNAFNDLKEYYLNEYKRDTNNFVQLKELAIVEYKNKEFEASLLHFEKLLKSKTKLNTDVYLYAGKTYKTKEKYLDAKEIFIKGLKLSIKNKNRNDMNLFNREIESIDWALKNNNIKEDIYSPNINKFINDYSIYNSNWFGDSLFLTCFENESSTTSTLLFNPKENKEHKINCKLKSLKIGDFTLYEANKIYFSICDSNRTCKIAIGDIKQDSLVNIRILKGLNYSTNSNYTMPFYFKNNEKQYLLYCSNNEKSKGGLDIFLSELANEDSVFNETNLSKINTPNDDLSPFYDNINNILYFSNSWMNGYGGIDIFKANFKNQTVSEIENLGKPINSSYNDLYFTIKDSIYTLTSNRKEKKQCCNNYYHFKTRKPINVDQTKIELFSSKELINSIKKDSSRLSQFGDLFPIKLYFHNDIPNPKSLDSITNSEYDVTFTEYLNLKNEYFLKNKQINTYKEIDDFFSIEIPKGYNDLNRLLDILINEISNENKFRIIIKGFASPLASNSYNIKLSKRRINSITNYIKKYKNGVLSDNIGTTITFEYSSLGEEVADKRVNDNPKIKKKSIYSIDAAKERKIELVGIKVSK